ncbi:MAG: lysylphosphatidylglycerol synthase transmembrane domain-containing protein [Pseudomonadota bacterium]|nr:lysylphosphatidylglycerol synthase transmembrane domain-containing protein [Pseudomonadota bacterium]
MGANNFFRINPRQLLGVVVVLVYGLTIELWLGWRNVLEPLVNLPAVLLLQMLLLLFLTYLVRALRLYSYFRPATIGRFGLSLSIMLTHNVLNHLLPARVGEVSLPVLLRQHLGVDLARGTAALVWFRLLDLHALLFIAACAVAFSWDSFPGLVAIGPGLSATVLLLVVGAFALLPVLLFVLLGRGVRTSTKTTSAQKGLISRLSEGVPTTFGEFLLSWLWTSLTWLVKLLTLAWLLATLLDISLLAAAVGVAGGELTAVLPVHAPGGFGTYAAGIVTALLPFAVDTNRAIAAAANTHLLLFASALVSGGIGWLLLPKGRNE